MTRDRLAVLGSPIHHSKSPAIHRAAYGVLGLDWEYTAVEVTEATIAEFVGSRDDRWRGLSLTMPLKRDILPLLDRRDPLVDLVGGANTVLFADEGLLGFNTDVYGVERSFREAGVDALASVHVIGAGATAASVIAGVARLGATTVTVGARTASKAEPLVALGTALGTDVAVVGLADAPAADAVVSTLPGGDYGLSFPAALRRRAVLFDVAYDPWPSALALQWQDAAGTVIPGIELLLNQAVGQVRVFVGGDPALPLSDEESVVAAMRSAVWKD